MARRIVGILLAVSAAFVLAWVVTYPTPDPKSIEYVCWKAGLCRMNLDLAADTMVGDAGSDKIVLGKTKEQLEKKLVTFWHSMQPHRTYDLAITTHFGTIDRCFLSGRARG